MQSTARKTGYLLCHWKECIISVSRSSRRVERDIFEYGTVFNQTKALSSVHFFSSDFGLSVLLFGEKYIGFLGSIGSMH